MCVGDCKVRPRVLAGRGGDAGRQEQLLHAHSGGPVRRAASGRVSRAAQAKAGDVCALSWHCPVQCHMPAHSQRPCQTVHTAVAPTRLPRGVSKTRLTPLCIPWRPISPLDRAWLVRSRGEISNSLPRTFIISGLWIPSRVPGLPSCLRRALSSCARRTRDGDSWVKLVPSPQSVCMTASSKLRAAQTPHRCRQPAALPTA